MPLVRIRRWIMETPTNKKSIQKVSVFIMLKLDTMNML